MLTQNFCVKSGGFQPTKVKNSSLKHSVFFQYWNISHRPVSAVGLFQWQGKSCVFSKMACTKKVKLWVSVFQIRLLILLSPDTYFTFTLHSVQMLTDRKTPYLLLTSSAIPALWACAAPNPEERGSWGPLHQDPHPCFPLWWEEQK